MAPTFNPQTLNPNPDSNNLHIEAVKQIRRESRKKHNELKRQKKLHGILENQLQTLLLEKSKPHYRPPPSDDSAWKSKYVPGPYDWFPQFTPGPEPKPWPSASNPEPTGLVWGAVNVKPKAKKVENAMFLTTNEVQKMCLKKCKEFLMGRGGGGDEDDDDVYDEEQGMEESVEFFRGVFWDDEVLRGYYETSWKKGRFLCLVCGGAGEKVGKIYGDCVGVVQHAMNVEKSKRVEAHRAYGKIVCEVLGWEVDRLPGVTDWEGYTDEVEMDEADDDADTT